jgi:hypothetical protein
MNEEAWISEISDMLTPADTVYLSLSLSLSLSFSHCVKIEI